MSESMTTNPYAVTTEALAGPDYGSDVETIRKMYLSHEASVQSIGSLYIIGAGLIGLVALAYLANGFSGAGRSHAAALAIVAGFVLASIAFLYGVTARGLQQLKPWARIVATVLSVFGLLAFPLGTVICGYFLYLLHSPRGAMVFSDEYRQIIQATPHIKYKTSVLGWILLGLFILLLIVLFVLAFRS